MVSLDEAEVNPNSVSAHPPFLGPATQYYVGLGKILAVDYFKFLETI
jgi:hypothetical protein